MSKATTWVLAALLVRCVAAGQAPAVPIEHYGPPHCSAANTAPHASPIDRALEEQRQGASDPHSLPSAEPMENFGVSRYHLADYADCVGASGCYWADLDAQYRRAEDVLNSEIAKRKPGDKLAVVLDIDETTLSSYCEMKREDFGYIDMMFNTWVVSADASIAIPGALRLFQKARSANVAVFFITGRPGVPGSNSLNQHPDQTAATARNLEAAGFHGWTGLALRNGPENSMSTIDYKSAERRRITGNGYRIVLSLGDQWSDLLGEPKAEVSIKLPNPFYFLP